MNYEAGRINQCTGLEQQEPVLGGLTGGDRYTQPQY